MLISKGVSRHSKMVGFKNTDFWTRRKPKKIVQNIYMLYTPEYLTNTYIFLYFEFQLLP